MLNYLYRHPNLNAPIRSNGIRFWGYPQRTKPIRLGVIHTPEVLPDFDGADHSAENVAAYFATVNRSASAHVCIDRDSTVDCLPDEAVAFHVIGYNSISLGAEVGHRHNTWGQRPDSDEAILDRAAKWWTPRTLTYSLPLRRLTRSRVDAGESGFAAHSDLDPDRRSDPGPLFDWERLFTLIERYQTEATIMGWTKPGDPVLSVGDADAVFAYQGSIADPKAASYEPANLAEANDRLWITLGRLTDLAMRHDLRIAQSSAGGVTSAQVAALIADHANEPATKNGPHAHTHTVAGVAE